MVETPPGAPDDDRVWRLRDGTPVIIRPLDAQDRSALVAFHRELSDRSVYLRYFGVASLEQRLDDARGSERVPSDRSDKWVLAAEVIAGERAKTIIGVGRLVPLAGGRTAETALLVSDPFQGQGLGGELLRRLIALAKDRGIVAIGAEMLPENEGMLAVARRFGFAITTSRDDSRLLKAELTL